MGAKPDIDELNARLRIAGRHLVWRERPESHFASKTTWKQWNSRNAGRIAGARTDYGRRVAIDGQAIFAHHIVWVLTHGHWPEQTIEHIDGNHENNDPDNLREGTYAHDFQVGAGIRQNSGGNWRATLGRQELGTYPTMEAAQQARDAALKARNNQTL